MKLGVLAVAFCALLAGCGGIYTSPQVLDQAAAGTALRVLPVTGESVLLANRTPYVPRQLPAVFSQTTGAGGLRGAGALPDATVTAQTPPGNLATRPLPQIDPGPYRVGVGDELRITQQSAATDQSRQQAYTVQDDGAIAMPEAGRIPVAGLTLTEIESAIFNAFVRSQIEPSFSVDISEFNAQQVSVGGGVGNPKVLPITLVPLTLQQALAAAGGIAVADQASSSVRVFREGTLYQMPLNTLMGSTEMLNARLIGGDSVFVDSAYDLDQAQAYFAQQITLSNARQQARLNALSGLQTEFNIRRAQLAEERSNFEFRAQSGAVARDYVYIAGEVGTQSRYTLPFEQEASLADALFDGAEGIPTRTGDVSQIYVLRASTDPREFGAVTAWHLDASNAVNFVLASRFMLRPGDVIFVAEQPVTRWNRVIQQITPSLINTSINAASN